MNTLTILDFPVKIDAEGRYCLNDLHKASGGEDRHRPVRFTRSEKFAELLTELEDQIPGINPVKIKRGRGVTGTYVVKELVYAYAMWLSPTFHLKVIRAYDALQKQGVAIADHAAEDILQDPLKYYRRVLDQACELKSKHEALANLSSSNLKTFPSLRRVGL